MSTHFTVADVSDQAGRTFLITGANTGIGFEAATVLAGKGARVLVGCRSRERAETAVRRIRSRHPDAALQIVDIDLGNLATVRRAAEQVAHEPRLDGLINNAGIMAPPRRLTADGFESQFGVNHLGHFALTGLLLPKLRDTEGARIVTVSSNAHKGAAIAFDDIHAERSYSRFGRYAMSKLANLLFTHELQRRLDAGRARAIAVACHPGASPTDLARHVPKRLVRILMPLARWISHPPSEGALPTLRAAADPQVRGGDYYGPAHAFELYGPPVLVRSHRASHDGNAARRLWELSIELTGVDPGK